MHIPLIVKKKDILFSPTNDLKNSYGHFTLPDIFQNKKSVSGPGPGNYRLTILLKHSH